MKYIYAALAGIAFTTPCFAQNITAKAGLSTLDLYAAPVFEMNENIDIRVPLYFGSQTISRPKVARPLMGKSHLNKWASCLINTLPAVGFASAAD